MDIKALIKLGNLDSKSEAEDIYMNLSLKFKNYTDGISKVKAIRNKYNLSFKAAVECALDASQLQMLKTMQKK